MHAVIRPEALEPRRLMAAAYTVVDVGALGGNDSIAYNLNDQNQVVGFALNALGEHRAFVFADANNNRLADPGEMRDLGVLPGHTASYAYGINNAGQIVGTSRSLPAPNDADERAVLFNPGAAPTDLGLGDGSNAYEIAAGAAVVGGLTSGNTYLAYVRAANAADDNAIAPDKTPATSAASRSFANITNYSRGINGIMVDVAGFDTPTAADFSFRVGGGSTSTWAAAPAPRSVTVRPGAGASGSDRVTITWDDGVIRNKWLEVTVRPTATTGLWAADVFYVGNLTGETGDAPTASVQTVSARDVLTTRRRMGELNVSITHPTDFNRDRRVDSQDYAIVRQNVGRSLSRTVPAAASVSSSPVRVAASRRTNLVELLA